jgi:hypothetical protein
MIKKSLLYMFVFQLLIVSVLGASWGSVDFRIYESDDPYVFPLVIDVENNLDREFTAELYVKTIYGDGSYGESELHKLIDVPKNPEMLYLDFPVSVLERTNDVLVIVEYNDESEEALYNSLTRLSLEMVITDKLPAVPEDLIEGVSEVSVEEDIGEVDVSLDDEVVEESKFKISTVVGVLIVLLLFAIVGFVAWLALKD